MASRVGKLYFSLGLALFQAVAAQAATITPETGTVLISQGSGFVPLVGQAQLSPGGRVMVQQGGQASIAYTADCMVRVPSGLWLVQEAAPCAKGAPVLDFTEKMGSGKSQDQTGAAFYDDPANVVFAISAGVITCLVWWCRGHDHHPASP